MNSWSAEVAVLLRNGLLIVALWALVILALGKFLTRPRHPRRPIAVPPAKKRPLTRDDFTLAA